MRQLVSLGCSIFAAGSLVACSTALLAPPAQAAPVFTASSLTAFSDADSSDDDPCTAAVSPSPALIDVPVAENGETTSLATSSTGRVTSDDDPSDVISFTTSMTTTGRVTSVGGNPGVIELSTNGYVQVDTTKPASSCELIAYDGGYLVSTFTVTQAGFMTFTTKSSRRSYGDVVLEDSTGQRILRWRGSGLSFSDVTSVYLAPGTYSSGFDANAQVVSATAVPSTLVAVSIKATFAVAGSQTTAVSGAGKRYLTFPANRSCATASVDVAVTGKGKRARQIRKVRLFVNDSRVRSIKTPKKGQLVKLPVPDEADAEVRAEVTLKPARPGRKPKTREVTAGYIACSASRQT